MTTACQVTENFFPNYVIQKSSSWSILHMKSFLRVHYEDCRAVFWPSSLWQRGFNPTVEYTFIMFFSQAWQVRTRVRPAGQRRQVGPWQCVPPPAPAFPTSTITCTLICTRVTSHLRSWRCLSLAMIFRCRSFQSYATAKWLTEQ